MLKFFILTILPLLYLNAQTENQIKQAKEYIDRTGMSKNDTINKAKSMDYTDSQIQDAIENEKVSKVESNGFETIQSFRQIWPQVV